MTTGASPSAGIVAYSASMNSYFSLTDAPSRSTLLLFSGTRSPSRARGHGVPVPGLARRRAYRRQRLSGKFSPVRLYPEPECGIVNLEFARHLGNRPRRRGVDHFLDGLLLELWSVMLRFPRHLIPFLSGENPIGSPVRKIWGTSLAPADSRP